MVLGLAMLVFAACAPSGGARAPEGPHAEGGPAASNAGSEKPSSAYGERGVERPCKTDADCDGGVCSPHAADARDESEYGTPQAVTQVCHPPGKR